MVQVQMARPTALSRWNNSGCYGLPLVFAGPGQDAAAAVSREERSFLAQDDQRSTRCDSLCVWNIGCTQSRRPFSKNAMRPDVAANASVGYNTRDGHAAAQPNA